MNNVEDAFGLAVLSFIIGWFILRLIVPNTHSNYNESTLTSEQINLSKLIEAEADPYDTLDMYLVGSVALNRAYHSNDFPNTVDSVIFQKSQFVDIDTSNSKMTNPRIDSIVVHLYKGIRRDYKVLYFYNPITATDKAFIRMMDRRRLLYITKKHLYF